ncbi:MAG: hypothetical protein M1832_003238 [Thelocarpon impressellum]|nr:MAG: hypothetical protein M1832_003238 [Thelocarpon impressellum]
MGTFLHRSKPPSSYPTMHAPCTLTALLFSLGAVAQFDIPVADIPGCTRDPLGTNAAIEKAEMRTCLANYNQGGWDPVRCSGRAWFKYGSKWRSAEECYDQCRECVDAAIREGLGNVKCEIWTYLAKCEMGYN